VSDPIDQEIRILRAIFWSERDPEGRAFVPLADAYLRRGDPQEALSLLEDGLGRHPDFSTAHLVAARVHRALGNTAGVGSALDAVLDLDPGNAAALRMRGEMAEAEGRLGEALSAFQSALQRNPAFGDLEARIERLRAEVPAGDSGGHEVEDVAWTWGGIETPGAAEAPGLDTVDPEMVIIHDDSGAESSAVDTPVDDEPVKDGDDEPVGDVSIAEAFLPGDPSPDHGEADSEDDLMLDASGFDLGDFPANPEGASGLLPDLDPEEEEEGARGSEGDLELAGFDLDDRDHEEALSAGDEDIPLDVPIDEGGIPLEADVTPVDADIAPIEADVVPGEAELAPIEAEVVPIEDSMVAEAPESHASLGAGGGDMDVFDPFGLDEAGVAGEPEAPTPPDSSGAAPAAFSPEEAPEDPADALPVTRTLGELYVKQGLVAEALGVFETLVDRHPDDAALRERLEELRQAVLPGDEVAEVSMAGEERQEAEASWPVDASLEPEEEEVVERLEVDEVLEDVPEADAPVAAGAFAAPFTDSAVGAAEDAEVEMGEEVAGESHVARLAGRPIAAYFEDLLAWAPGAVPIEHLAPGSTAPLPGGPPTTGVTPAAGTPVLGDLEAPVAGEAGSGEDPGQTLEGLDDFQDWLRSLNR
jgi:tetratricopeptide (TPR) repeat protein